MDSNHPTSQLVSSNTDQKDRELEIQRDGHGHGDGDGEKQECQNVVVLMKPSVADKPPKKRRRSADESLENMTTVVNLINFSNDDTYRRGRLSQSPPQQQMQPQLPPLQRLQPQLQSLPPQQPQTPVQQQTRTQPQLQSLPPQQPQTPAQQQSPPQRQLQSLPPQQPQTPAQQQAQPQSPPQQRPQPQLQSLPPQQPQTPPQQQTQPQSQPQQRPQPQLQSLPPQQPQTPLQLQARSPLRLERLYLQPEQLQPQAQQSKSQLPPLPNFPVRTELRPQSQAQLRVLPEPIPENRYKCDIDSCERSFSSFQALGGHRASHRYKEQPASNANAIVIDDQVPSTTENSCSVPTPGIHKCDICLKAFTSGQALGGHKRCHYQGVLNGKKRDNEDSVSGGEGVEGGGIRSNQSGVSELITIGSEKRNSREELCIDLNKTPPAEAEKEEGNCSGGGGGEVEKKMRFLIECNEDFISQMDDSVKIMGKYIPPP